MAVSRKGFRGLVVDGRQYFWRATGTDWGITVVAVTEAAFIKGATAQQLTFTLRYDHLQTPGPRGSISLKQRAAVAPGVVALAIRRAVASNPSFTGNIGEPNLKLPSHILGELQENARLEPQEGTSERSRLMTWEELQGRVRDRRDYGVVTITSMTRPPAADSRQVADRLAESVGYSGMGKHWTPLSSESAAKVLCFVLAQDLALSSRVMSTFEAQELATAFMAHLGSDAEFFTNGSWVDRATPGGGRASVHWLPITSATFDAGVVGIGGERAAILWVEDED